MHLRALEELGLVTPKPATGVFKTFPHEAQVTIATTTIAYFARNVSAAAASSLRSPEDLAAVLEAVGTVFSFPLPAAEANIVSAAKVYVWMLDPANADRMPATAAIGTPERSELIVACVRHLSQAFEPRSDRPESSFRTVVLECADAVSAIVAANAAHLPPSDPAWQPLIEACCAVVKCNEDSRAVPKTRATTGSVLLETLVRSRVTKRDLWALAGDCCFRSKAPLAITKVWRAAVTALARSVSAALVSQELPEALRIDWPWIPNGVRQASTVNGHSVADQMKNLTSLLSLLGPLQHINDIEALYETTSAVADVAFLFANAAFWPADVPSASRFDLTGACEPVAVAPRVVPPGASTHALASLVGNTLLVVLKCLPASPPSGNPTTPAAVLAQRARVAALNGASAVFLRREAASAPSELLAPFVAAAVDALEDSSLVVQGQALLATLPVYGAIAPAKFPKKLESALLISSSTMMAPHLQEVTEDIISNQRGGVKANLRPQATEPAPETGTTGDGGGSPAPPKPAPPNPTAAMQSPRGAVQPAAHTIAPDATISMSMEAAAVAQGADSGGDFDMVVDPSDEEPSMLLSFRQAACSHFANAGVVCPCGDHTNMVLGGLLRALADFGSDCRVLAPLLSCTTHVLTQLSDSITAEAPVEGDASDGSSNRVAGPRFEMTASVVEHATRLLSVSNPSGDAIALVLVFLREVPLPSPAIAQAVLEAMSDFACALRRGLDVSGITNSIVARRQKDPQTGASSQGGGALDAESASRLFALTARAMSRLCSRMNEDQLRASGSSSTKLFTSTADAITAVLQVVDAGFKTTTQVTYHQRDAAEQLLNDLFALQRWPMLEGDSGTSLGCVESAYAAKARSIKAFGVSNSRLLTVMHVAGDDDAEPDYLIVVCRDTAGRWSWRVEEDELAKHVPADTADAQRRALDVLTEFAPTGASSDILARTSLDGPRHEAVIRRWKADAPLADALRSMEAAEGASARAGAADTREFPSHLPEGRLSLAESGEYTALTRKLLCDIGLVSQRTQSLTFDATLVRRLRALDAASAVETFDIPVLRYGHGQSPSAAAAAGSDDLEEDDVLRFHRFCASLGLSAPASKSSSAQADGESTGMVRVSQTVFANVRYHCRDWSQADDDLAHSPHMEMASEAAPRAPPLRILWDSTPERYDYTAIPTVSTRAFQSLNPQWRPRSRLAVDVVVTPLQSASAEGGLFLVRLLLPSYLAGRPASAFSLAPPLLPNTQTVVPAAGLHRLLRSIALGFMQDAASSAPGAVSPVFVRRRAIEAVTGECAKTRTPDPLGTRLLSDLLLA